MERGNCCDNFPLVLAFQKKTYKEQLVCYHLMLILKFVTIMIAFVPVPVYTFGKKITFYHFSKQCLSSVVLHIEAQLSLKNAWLPPVFFLDFNSP